MVIHDETRMQALIQEQERQQQQQKKQKPTLRLSVVAVQSIACCIVVLVVLLLQVAGGEAYGTLRQHFRQALARNEWVTVLSRVWDDNPLEQAEKDTGTGVKANGFTDDEAAQLVGSSAITVAVPPLESGTITSAYGQRIHPISGGEEFHTGVDIAAPAGTELMSMFDGEVVEVGENDALGRYVRLRHSGDIEVLYGHCERIVARTGDSVKGGDTVALVGSTGISTGNHVHLCVRVDGVTCDPAAILSLERYA